MNAEFPGRQLGIGILKPRRSALRLTASRLITGAIIGQRSTISPPRGAGQCGWRPSSGLTAKRLALPNFDSMVHRVRSRLQPARSAFQYAAVHLASAFTDTSVNLFAQLPQATCGTTRATSAACDQQGHMRVRNQALPAPVN